MSQYYYKLNECCVNDREEIRLMAHNSSLLLNNYYVTSTGKEVLLQYNALLQYILIKLRCFAKGTRRKVKNQSGKYYHYNIKQENQSPAYNNIAILIYIYITS